MAKRFTDTEKYKKAFMRALPGPYKLLWDYLYLDCDHAGIWHKDFDVAQIRIGVDMPINEQEALKLFNTGEERVRVIRGGDKWFIIPFVGFQYGVLNPENRLHASVLSALQRHSIENLIKVLGSPLEGPSVGAKDKDKDKDRVKVKEKEGGVGETKPGFDFSLVWERYPKKDGRKQAEKHFKATVLTNDDWSNLNTALENYLKHVKGKELQFVKNGSTWFNNWQDWIGWKGDANATTQRSYGDRLFEREDERKSQTSTMGTVPKLFR